MSFHMWLNKYSCLHLHDIMRVKCRKSRRTIRMVTGTCIHPPENAKEGRSGRTALLELRPTRALGHIEAPIIYPSPLFAGNGEIVSYGQK